MIQLLFPFGFFYMAPRSTAAQYQLLIKMIENINEIRYGKGTPDKKREAIAENLNALGGAFKSGDGWKKVSFSPFLQI